MANLVNPVSVRLSYNRYWNNTWAIGKQINYSYICMLDFFLFKYLSFLWDKLKWYRKGVLFIGFKFFRIFNKVWLNFIYRNHNLSFFLKEALALDDERVRPSKAKFSVSKRYNSKFKNYKDRKFISKYVTSVWTLKQRGLWGSKKRVRRFLRVRNKRVVKNKNITFKEKLIINSVSKIVRRIKVNSVNAKLHIFKYIIYSLLSSLYFAFWKFYMSVFLRKFMPYVYINVHFILTSLAFVDARYICKFIKTKLIQRFPFRWIMNFLSKRLRFAIKRKYIYGFKILLSGRFSRRDRATYYWRIKGKVPFNSVSAKVQYVLFTVKLLNSLCGIKVWLNLRKNPYKVLIF